MPLRYCRQRGCITHGVAYIEVLKGTVSRDFVPPIFAESRSAGSGSAVSLAKWSPKVYFLFFKAQSPIIEVISRCVPHILFLIKFIWTLDSWTKTFYVEDQFLNRLLGYFLKALVLTQHRTGREVFVMTYVMILEYIGEHCYITCVQLNRDVFSSLVAHLAAVKATRVRIPASSQTLYIKDGE